MQLVCCAVLCASDVAPAVAPRQGAGEILLHRPLLPAPLGLQASHLYHLLNVLCHQGLVQLGLGN